MVAWLSPSMSCSCFSTGCTLDSHQVRGKVCLYTSRGNKTGKGGGGRCCQLQQATSTALLQAKCKEMFIFFSDFLSSSSCLVLQLFALDFQGRRAELTHGFSIRRGPWAVNLASCIPACHGAGGQESLQPAQDTKRQSASASSAGAQPRSLIGHLFAVEVFDSCPNLCFQMRSFRPSGKRKALSFGAEIPPKRNLAPGGSRQGESPKLFLKLSSALPPSVLRGPSCSSSCARSPCLRESALSRKSKTITKSWKQ